MGKVAVKVKWATKSGERKTTQMYSDKLSDFRKDIRSRQGTIISIKKHKPSGGTGRTYYKRKRPVPTTPAQHRVEEKVETIQQLPARLKARKEYQKSRHVPEDIRGQIETPEEVKQAGMEEEYERAAYEKYLGIKDQQFHSGSGQPMPSKFEQGFQRWWQKLPPEKQFEYGLKYGDLKDKPVFETTKYKGASEYYSSLPEEERQKKVEELRKSKEFQEHLKSGEGQAELKAMMESQYEEKVKPKDKPWWEHEVGFVRVYQPSPAKEKIALLKLTTSPVDYKKRFFKELHPVVKTKTTLAKNLGQTLSIPITLPQMAVKHFNKGKTLFLPDVGKSLEKRSVSPVQGAFSGTISEASSFGGSNFFEQAQKKPFLTGVATGGEIVGFKLLSAGYSATASRFPAVSRYNPYNMFKQNLSSFSTRGQSWLRNYFRSSPRLPGKFYRVIQRFKISQARGMKPPSQISEKIWTKYYGMKESAKQGLSRFGVERGLVSPYRAVHPVGYSWKVSSDPILTGEYQRALLGSRIGGNVGRSFQVPSRYVSRTFKPGYGTPSKFSLFSEKKVMSRYIKSKVPRRPSVFRSQSQVTILTEKPWKAAFRSKSLDTGLLTEGVIDFRKGIIKGRTVTQRYPLKEKFFKTKTKGEHIGEYQDFSVMKQKGVGFPLKEYKPRLYGHTFKQVRTGVYGPDVSKPTTFQGVSFSKNISAGEKYITTQGFFGEYSDDVVLNVSRGKFYNPKFGIGKYENVATVFKPKLKKSMDFSGGSSVFDTRAVQASKLVDQLSMPGGIGVTQSKISFPRTMPRFGGFTRTATRSGLRNLEFLESGTAQSSSFWSAVKPRSSSISLSAVKSIGGTASVSIPVLGFMSIQNQTLGMKNINRVDVKPVSGSIQDVSSISSQVQLMLPRQKQQSKSIQKLGLSTVDVFQDVKPVQPVKSVYPFSNVFVSKPAPKSSIVKPVGFSPTVIGSSSRKKKKRQLGFDLLGVGYRFRKYKTPKIENLFGGM